MCWVLPAGNQIGDAGARALANSLKGLKGLKGLEELSLGGKCVIGCWVVARSCRGHTIAHPRQWWVWLWRC